MHLSPRISREAWSEVRSANAVKMVIARAKGEVASASVARLDISPTPWCDLVADAALHVLPEGQVGNECRRSIRRRKQERAP